MREEEKYLLLQAERIGQATTLSRGMSDTARHCQEECQTLWEISNLKAQWKQNIRKKHSDLEIFLKLIECYFWQF